MKIFGKYELCVREKVKPLRVRVTERSEELKELLLNKELEHIELTNKINLMQEQREHLERWLENERDDAHRAVREYDEMVAGHSGIVDLETVPTSHVTEPFPQT